MSRLELTADKIRHQPIRKFLRPPEGRHVYCFQVIGKQTVLTVSQRMVYDLPVVVDGLKYDVTSVEIMQDNLAEVRLVCRSDPPL